MKFVRKTTAVLLAVVICMLLSVAAYAAEDSTVWLKVDQADSTTVEIAADTTVTDGVITLTYDSSALTYQGITAAESHVSMYAVNDQTPGVLMISWVAPGAYEAAGEHGLFTLNFTGVEQANTVRIAGTVHDAGGNAVTLGQTQVTQKPQEESTDSTSGTEGGDSANTGDRSHLLAAACVGLLAACGAAAVLKKGWGAR